METQNKFEVQKKSKEENKPMGLPLLRCKYVRKMCTFMAGEGGRWYSSPKRLIQKRNEIGLEM